MEPARHASSTVGTTSVAALDEDQRDFAEVIDRYCTTHASSHFQAARRSGDTSYDRAAHKATVELGWMRAPVDVQYGGDGGSRSSACVLLGALVRGGMPLLGLASTFIVADIIAAAGTEEQKSTVLPAICKGQVMAIAMTEPEAGSDVTSLRCAATQTAGGYVIDGHKTWISAAHVADYVLVAARTSDSPSASDGLSLFLVPRSADGLTTAGIDTLAGREVNDVFLASCEVPSASLVGEEGGAWSVLKEALTLERTLIASAMLGLAQAAFADARAYVTSRRQFGRSVASFQVVRHRLADLALEIECCVALVEAAMRSLDSSDGVASGRRAALAKLKASETARQAALEGMQLMGANGYSDSSAMQHRVRMALGSTIYGGTSEIQREIIARHYVPTQSASGL